jgi:ribosomal protein S18 acetylase RimI-like enzyme
MTDVPLAPAQTEPVLGVERIEAFNDEDMHALCEATHAAIIEGGGFGWVRPPERRALETYFRGLLLVPERQVFVARLNHSIVGSAQLVRPPRNNEAQAFSAHLMHAFIAPYARGHGLARMLTLKVEEAARAMKFQVLNLDVRETQQVAIRLYESLGYQRWGEHPLYARVRGKSVRGLFYYKLLQPASG